MKNIFFTLIIYSLFSVSNLWAQVKVDDSKTITELVKSLEGPGVKISNITVVAPNVTYRPYGSFQDKNKTIGLNKGVLMTSGAARYAQGPNSSDGQGQMGTNNTYDPDLGQITTGTMRDLCRIEFDIITSANFLTFNYVFASEEYPEYVNASYNDVFGFFISGPGIVGTKNIALIPNTNIPVAIDNVNQYTHTQYYNSNFSGNLNFQYDGYTDVLPASVEVLPCQTYHIKLAIADVGDDRYDSGVFLEQGSFKSEHAEAPILKVVYEHSNFDFAIEGCNKAKLLVIRNPILSKTTELKYGVNVAGTAINVFDYAQVADSVTIPSNVDTAIIDFNFFADNLKEFEEKVFVGVKSKCPIFPHITSIEFPVRDVFPFSISSENVCAGVTTTLNKNPDPTKTYVWDANPSLSCTDCSSPMVTLDGNKYFPFTITDNISGCQVYDSILARSLKVEASFTHSLEKCYTSLDIFFTNTSKNAKIYTWDFGDGSDITNDKNPSHLYPFNNSKDPIQYTIRLTARSINPACTDDTTVTITINEPLYIPNLITANKDGKNDFLEIQGIGNECWTLTIFNRWGSVVYTKDNYNSEFDGLNLPENTYFYHLKNGSNDREYKGWVEIIDKPIEESN